jgi:hypothetical protein
MKKFKQWLFTADEEGLNGFDAICMFIWNLAAWSLMIFVARRFG